MNSMTDLYKRQGTGLTTCLPPEPRCLTCGMLECVCRPRFFAGQVLTADDLNRLDAYIRAKHRLHNRQLHGWGVVNGLEVTCNPCGDGVMVGCGYALSPCGDDIVVCDAVTVDVCDLIKRCRDAEKNQQPCAPFQQPGAVDCEAAEEDWILAIRYAETPARGVKPLYSNGNDCSCGKSSCSCCGSKTKTAACTCGAGGGGGCSCGSKACKPAKPRNAPVQCEPTVICEGFAFEVYRKPADPVPPSDRAEDDLNPDSELVKRFECCFDLLVTKAPVMPGAFTVPNIQANPAAWYLWACQFRDHLTRFFQSRPGYNCALIAQLNTVAIMPVVDAASANLLAQAISVMLVVWLDGILACWCSALLPPCPEPTDEVRVPLATVHVSRTPCRVLRVCNWTIYRKFATTFPSLQYWLSVWPFGKALRQLLQAICCYDLTIVFQPPDSTPPPVPGTPPVGDVAAGGGIGVAAGGIGGAGGSGFQPRAYERATMRLNPSLRDPRAMDNAAALLSSTLAADPMLAPQSVVETFLVPPKARGEGALSAVEARNFPQFFAVRQMLKPLAMPGLTAVMPNVLAGAFGAPAAEGPGEAATQPPGEEELAQLRGELRALRQRVDAQAAEVARLKKRKG